MTENNLQINSSHSYLRVLKELSCLQRMHQLAKDTIGKQKEQLYSSKIFLNMVVHDMRNPTHSISTGLQ